MIVMTHEAFLATLPPVPDWQCCRCGGPNFWRNPSCCHCGGPEVCGNSECQTCEHGAPPMGPFVAHVGCCQERPS